MKIMFISEDYHDDHVFVKGTVVTLTLGLANKSSHDRSTQNLNEPFYAPPQHSVSIGNASTRERKLLIKRIMQSLSRTTKEHMHYVKRQGGRS